MIITHQLDAALQCLRQGKLLAYPTEAVYGLGCDPFNQQAVDKLLALKQRTSEKGLILLIADWHQLPPLIADISDETLTVVRESWPGPVTWLFPKSSRIPDWLSGCYDTIAIRMTAHPLARELCRQAPLVSTSANLSGHEPARDLASVCGQFPYGIDVFLEGALGGATSPSAIYDARTRKRLR